MAKLLYIESSPRKARSASIATAQAFLDAYRATHPGDAIEVLDLWAERLPELDEEFLNARYAVGSGQALDAAQQAAWDRVIALANRFKSADKIVISAPMWNFNVPYKLKHFMDAVTHPGVTFSFSPATGYQGLMAGKPAALILARGGEYVDTPATPWDQQRPYLNQWLGFVGITDVRHVFVEATMNPAKADAAKAAALEAARALAAAF